MSDEAIRLLAQAGEVTILSFALLAFCLIFGPALFKLIGTMTDFLQRLTDINLKLSQQMDETRRTLTLSTEADEQQTAAIHTNTTTVDRARADVRALSGTVTAGFAASDAKLDEQTERILHEFTPILNSLQEINTSVQAMQKALLEHRGEDASLQTQVQSLSGQLETAEHRIISAFRDALKVAL
jgi:chromosome segregation ATPase